MTTCDCKSSVILAGVILGIAWSGVGCARSYLDPDMAHPTMKEASNPRRIPSSQIHQLEVCMNCYALLHDLLKDQSQVEKVLWVKLETEDLRPLLKSIALASAAGAQTLEGFVKADPTLRLTELQLPPGERATREAIRRTKTKEFLSPFNPDFEMVFLQTEAEALCYAWHLANVAAENDTSSTRAEALRQIGRQMRQLHKDVFLRLRLAAARACAARDVSVARPPEKPTPNP